MELRTDPVPAASDKKAQLMPVARTLCGGDPCGFFDPLWITRAAQSHIVRKNGGSDDVVIAVNRLDAIEQRNFETRVQGALLIPS